MCCDDGDDVQKTGSEHNDFEKCWGMSNGTVVVIVLDGGSDAVDDESQSACCQCLSGLYCCY